MEKIVHKEKWQKNRIYAEREMRKGSKKHYIKKSENKILKRRP